VLTTLFDKSFLQSISVDESVWFDQHFMPVVCPVFYAETLADLALAPTNPAFVEREVRKIADKFPQMCGYPCASHFTMSLGTSSEKPPLWMAAFQFRVVGTSSPGNGAGSFSIKVQKHSRSSDGSVENSSHWSALTPPASEALLPRSI